eukprot:835969-Amphidinium_carterae.1
MVWRTIRLSAARSVRSQFAFRPRHSRRIANVTLQTCYAWLSLLFLLPLLVFAAKNLGLCLTRHFIAPKVNLGENDPVTI